MVECCSSQNSTLTFYVTIFGKMCKNPLKTPGKMCKSTVKTLGKMCKTY